MWGAAEEALRQRNLREAAVESFRNETARTSGSLPGSRLGRGSRKHVPTCDPGNVHRGKPGLGSGVVGQFENCLYGRSIWARNDITSNDPQHSVARSTPDGGNPA